MVLRRIGVVICTKCARVPVIEGGMTLHVGHPSGPLCMDCFYQTPEGREEVERRSHKAEIINLADARRERRRLRLPDDA